MYPKGVVFMTNKRCPDCGQATVEEQTDTIEVRLHSEKHICLNCSKTFGIQSTDPKQSPEKHCDTFYFSYGGFFEGYQSIKVEEKDGYADLIIADPQNESEKADVRFRIMLSEWQDIKTTLFYDLFILSWKASYNDPHILDGTQWELRLEFDDRETIKKSGSNAFPALYDDLVDYLKPYFDQGDFERE